MIICSISFDEVDDYYSNSYYSLAADNIQDFDEDLYLERLQRLG